MRLYICFPSPANEKISQYKKASLSFVQCFNYFFMSLVNLFIYSYLQDAIVVLDCVLCLAILLHGNVPLLFPLYMGYSQQQCYNIVSLYIFTILINIYICFPFSFSHYFRAMGQYLYIVIETPHEPVTYPAETNYTITIRSKPF